VSLTATPPVSGALPAGGRDDPFRVLHEIDQQVEDLRLDHDRLGAAPQLAARDIEDVRFQRRAKGSGVTLRV
jgi:hypothetical protein